jgi:hypothetical protein
VNERTQIQPKTETPSFSPSPSLAPRTNLLQHKCACGGTPGLDGECVECRRKRLTRQRHPSAPADRTEAPPIVHDVLRSSGWPQDASTRALTEATFGHNFGEVLAYPKGVPKDQTRLTVNVPGDAYEQEADRVADQVMRVSALPVKGIVSRGAERVLLRKVLRPQDFVDSVAPSEEEVEEESPSPGPQPALQRSSTGGAIPVTTDFEQSLQRSILSGREALTHDTRTFMETRFGRDFAEVRIHRDARAEELAHSVNARAFTVGNDIFFARSTYQPDSVGGRRLIAHELTHVLQQSASDRVIPGRIQRQLAVGHPCPRYIGYEASRSVETYNCAGLALRNYQFIAPASTVVKTIVATFPSGRSITCGPSGGPSRVKFWLWEYDLHLEDDRGSRLSESHRDFHIVAGVTDRMGNDPTDVYSKNGMRPVEGPGTGPGFRPPGRNRALNNDATATPATTRDGRPVFKVRYNFSESCFSANCPP